ncbi:electron transfer flavoprotein subunit beta/FixA family protein [Thiohalorhabdus sp. Cl-TMA]|uniref:Electron transfer flavoprotein subunit beta n=1 Tax=Thiohalorhabdus methylotrophus TaxID=3242694 RepID=A0ABV4TXD5_9GAMM
MKILVPVKQVATLDEEFELQEDELDVDHDFCEYDINEWDDYSLEEALQIKEANEGQEVEVIALTVGDDDAEDALRTCMAKGADRAVRIWDDAMEGADPMAIARAIAKFVEQEKPDLVFAGVQSSDQAFAQTGMQVAALLGWPHAAVVNNLDYTPGAGTATVRRELEGGLEEEVEVQVPAVMTIQLGINDPRYASLKGIKQAKSRPIDEYSPADLGLSEDEMGASGSLSQVRKVYVPEKGQAEMIEGTPAEQAARLAEIIKEFKGAAS